MTLIANWYNEKLGVDFPEKKHFLVKELVLDMVKILIKKFNLS